MTGLAVAAPNGALLTGIRTRFTWNAKQLTRCVLVELFFTVVAFLLPCEVLTATRRACNALQLPSGTKRSRRAVLTSRLTAGVLPLSGWAIRACSRSSLALETARLALCAQETSCRVTGIATRSTQLAFRASSLCHELTVRTSKTCGLAGLILGCAGRTRTAKRFGASIGRYSTDRAWLARDLRGKVLELSTDAFQADRHGYTWARRGCGAIETFNATRQPHKRALRTIEASGLHASILERPRDTFQADFLS